MQSPMLGAATTRLDPLILRIARLSDGQTIDYSLYEDSSVGRGYMTGEFATTSLHATRSASTLTITVDPVKGLISGNDH